jgi:hypothetical protein
MMLHVMFLQQYAQILDSVTVTSTRSLPIGWTELVGPDRLVLARESLYYVVILGGSCHISKQ